MILSESQMKSMIAETSELFSRINTESPTADKAHLLALCHEASKMLANIADTLTK